METSDDVMLLIRLRLNALLHVGAQRRSLFSGAAGSFIK